VAGASEKRVRALKEGGSDGGAGEVCPLPPSEEGVESKDVSNDNGGNQRERDAN
jgi:hypothetical protein